MLFIHEMLLVYKLETVKNCKEVKHVMIMIIAIICIFLILCDTWWTVENYFQKILRPPWKNPLPPPPRPPFKFKDSKSPSFRQHWKFYRSLLQKGWGGSRNCVKLVSKFSKIGRWKNYSSTWSKHKAKPGKIYMETDPKSASTLYTSHLSH